MDRDDVRIRSDFLVIARLIRAKWQNRKAEYVYILFCLCFVLSVLRLIYSTAFRTADNRKENRFIFTLAILFIYKFTYSVQFLQFFLFWSFVVQNERKEVNLCHNWMHECFCAITSRLSWYWPLWHELQWLRYPIRLSAEFEKLSCHGRQMIVNKSTGIFTLHNWYRDDNKDFRKKLWPFDEPNGVIPFTT